MPWWTAAALTVFGAVVVVTAIVLAVLAAKTVREIARARVTLTEALEGLTAALERLDGRLADASEQSAEIERRIAALDASLEKLSILRSALGDAGRTYRRFRSAVPRK